MTSNEITDDDLILVTGASGYIACHIVQQLLAKGYRVRGTVRNLKDEKKVGPLRKLHPNPKHELELVEADLLREETWLNAVKDCTYVIHTASPFPLEQPANEDELIKPAMNGTLFVLRACVANENTKVKRVVLTSSVAAIVGSAYDNKTYTEADWPDLGPNSGIQAYPKSKTLAEKAAWDFIETRKKDNLYCFELSVINPGFVTGPTLHDINCSSIELIKRLVNRDLPMLPDLYIPSCDVRDVATAHLKAMVLADAVSKRHIVVTTVECLSMRDWAVMLDAELRPKNYNLPTRLAPHWLIKLAGIFDKSIRPIASTLGKKSSFQNDRMINVLGIKPIEVKQSLIDMVYSMIERGMVPKKF